MHSHHHHNDNQKHHHHHHHSESSHCHHHHHEGVSLNQFTSLFKQYITPKSLKSYIKELWTHTNLRSLYIYTLALFLFNLIEFFVAFFKSGSLIVIFASLYTLQRVFHYIIMIIVSIMKKNNLMTRDNSRHVPYVEYSYGLGRVEVIMKFSNGVYAVFVAFSLLIESVHSLADQHEIKNDYVLVLTVIGLLMNFVGVYMFSNTLNNSNFAMPTSSTFSSAYQKSNPLTNLCKCIL
jgi:Co/Zn/Cd efflux system component